MQRKFVRKKVVEYTSIDKVMINVRTKNKVRNIRWAFRIVVNDNTLSIGILSHRWMK